MLEGDNVRLGSGGKSNNVLPYRLPHPVKKNNK